MATAMSPRAAAKAAIEAIKENDEKRLRVYLSKSPRLIDYCDEHDYTPLHHACTRRDTGKIVALLLSHGADVDAMDSMDTTPLSLAATEADLEVVELLIANEADINTINMDGDTPLHNAAGNARDDVIDLLLRSGAVITESLMGRTPLHYVSRSILNGGHPHRAVACARLLVETDTEIITVEDEEGTSPVHLSAEIDAHAVTAVLLALGAKEDSDINSPTFRRQSIIWARRIRGALMPAAVAAAKQLLREHVQCSVTTSAAAAAAAEASKQSATSEEGRTAPEGAITKLTAGGTAVAALQLLLDAEWCAKAWRERLVEWAEVPEEERELEDTHPLSNDKGAAVSTAPRFLKLVPLSVRLLARAQLVLEFMKEATAERASLPRGCPSVQLAEKAVAATKATVKAALAVAGAQEQKLLKRAGCSGAGASAALPPRAASARGRGRLSDAVEEKLFMVQMSLGDEHPDVRAMLHGLKAHYCSRPAAAAGGWPASGPSGKAAGKGEGREKSRSAEDACDSDGRSAEEWM